MVSDAKDFYETPPNVAAHLERLLAMSPKNREAWVRKFNAADGKAYAEHLVDEGCFQAMLDKFAQIAPLPPSLAGLRVVASGMDVPMNVNDQMVRMSEGLELLKASSEHPLQCSTFPIGETLWSDVGHCAADDPIAQLVAWNKAHLRPFRGIVPRGYIESPAQRERRQARNKRKAARRKAKR